METKVLTPFGFKLLGDVAVGDAICNPDGTVARVIQVHERGLQQFYRITMDDGSNVEACGEHLWAASLAGARTRRKKAAGDVPDGMRPEDEWNLRLMQRSSVVTTLRLKELVDRERKKAEAGVRANYVQLPLTAPVMMTAAPGKWPTLPPYTLGAFIGDGSLNEYNVTLTCADASIAERIQAELGDRLILKPSAPRNHCPVYRLSGAVGQKTNSPQNLLRRDGLLSTHSWDKFIPERIKYSPPETRWAFMQGLFDTDGSMDERGHVDFVTVSERLAKDVQWVCRSLGLKATLSGKQPTYTHKGEKLNGRPAYRLYIRGPHQEMLFGLARKRERVTKYNGQDVWPSHRVVSVEPTVVDNARCITVSNPNALYITDDFIVTHNSDALLMAALQYVHVRGYRALLLRSSFAALALPDSLMDRAKQWLLGSDAKWNEDLKTFTFPSGATITFGYLESEKDLYRYMGAAFQGIFFDELTQFPERYYTFLFSRLRKLRDHDVPLRMRSASNPGSQGHEWVKRRFLIEGRAKGRIFVPAGLDDNPGLDAESYKRSLDELDPTLRAQLLAGDWDAVTGGGKFSRTWFNGKIKERKDVPEFQRVVRFWDLAATEVNEKNTDPDWTAGVKIGVTADRDFWVLDVRRKRDTAKQIERFIRDTAEEDGWGVDIFIEQEPGSSGKALIDHYHREVLSGFSIKGERSTGDKLTRANPVASAAEAGNLFLVRAPWNTEFLSELEVFGMEIGHDDMVDALSGAYQKLKRKGGDMTFGTADHWEQAAIELSQRDPWGLIY